MLGTYFTFPELLIWIPLVVGIICFAIKKESQVKVLAFAASLATLGVAIAAICFSDASKYPTYNQVSYYWLRYLGNAFHLRLDSTSFILSLLTAVAYPIIFLASYNQHRDKPASYYGLMLLAQAGIMGVFSAVDALAFYFFWELALIPVYFLCSTWGGEKRIATTFKFFVYTFAGSLLMLTGIIYIYMHTPGRVFTDGTSSAHSFALASFMQANISEAAQGWLFWLFFASFAVKMPIFPLHTWQPDTYDQSPTPVTMVLSGLMVKMGLFGMMRWLMPVLPEGVAQYGNIAITLAVIGILYASCIALVQDNLKKLVAYSSIAHIGLMAAALLTQNASGVQGAVLQMFNHGINIIGMWIVVDMIEQKTGIKHISKLGGLANKAPVLTIFMVIIALANIALPLTNAFVGEFLMFNGLWKFNSWFAVAAIISIILAAVYTLNMIRKTFYGEMSAAAERMTDITISEKIALSVIVLLIFALGIYPEPILKMTEGALQVLAVPVGR